MTNKKPISMKFPTDTRLILDTRATIAGLNGLSELCEAMTKAMRSPNFEPLPAFTVEPWKTLDNE